MTTVTGGWPTASLPWRLSASRRRVPRAQAYAGAFGALSLTGLALGWLFGAPRQP